MDFLAVQSHSCTGLQISISQAIYNALREMSTEKKSPFKQDQALNDSTSGQLGEEPRADDIPDSIREMENSRQKAARKLSRAG